MSRKFRPTLESLESRLTPSASSSALDLVPVSFEPNLGQTGAAIDFLARGVGYSTFLTPTEAVLRLHPRSGGVQTDAVLRLQIVDGNPSAHAAGLDLLPGTSNYYTGADPSAWHTDVPNFARVEYQDVYPGIDLVYHGNQRNLEYDFLVAPGADPSRIRLNVEGADGLSLDGEGNLVLHTAAGDVVEHAPVAYQESNGVREAVRANYLLDEGQIRFAIGPYDPSRLLVIDPRVDYTGFVGGFKGEEIGYGIAADAEGNVWLTGFTNSEDFPATVGAFQTALGNPIVRFPSPPPVPEGGDAFVAKLDAFGTAFIATYLGGMGSDAGHGITVDGDGNAYVVGTTSSSNFPVVGGMTASVGGSFVAKFAKDGRLLASSQIDAGGDGGTFLGNGIGVDGSGNVYVGGYTIQDNLFGRGFVLKLAPSLSTVLRDTTIDGGTGVGDLAVDRAGNVYLIGGLGVTRLDPGGATVYSRGLGGSGFGGAYGIAADGDGNAWVVGQTFATDFPTVNAFQSTPGGSSVPGFNADGFVVKLGPDGETLLSSYLGGNGNDYASAVVVDADGNAYVTGGSGSTVFPATSDAVQSVAGNAPALDPFVTKITRAGRVAFSSLIGQTFQAVGYDITTDGAGVVYVTGDSGSGANGGLIGQAHAAFVTRLTIDMVLCVNVTGDEEDADPDDGVLDTDLNRFGPQVTLRAAINYANAHKGGDYICFDIPGAGVPTIRPERALPVITEAVVIDATTQPGSGWVELDGSRAGDGTSGLVVTSGGSTIKGLAIDRFSGDGIVLKDKGKNTIEHNLVGLTPDGDGAGNGGAGVRIENSPDNHVGGQTQSTRNVISSNRGDGVRIEGAKSTGNVVEGNYIGSDENDLNGRGNAMSGVRVTGGARNNTVGGTDVNSRNVIGYNETGVRIDGGATGNVLLSNFIGTDVTGTIAHGNLDAGVVIEDAPGNTVGGTYADGNVISGNKDGIRIKGAASTANTVLGNFIGTTASGLAKLGNTQNGVVIDGAANNVIGGTTESARNAIAGNDDVGVLITGREAHDNRVEGNFIGLGADGGDGGGGDGGGGGVSAAGFFGAEGGSQSAATSEVPTLGNRGGGVKVTAEAHDNIIGDDAEGARNIIANNGNPRVLGADFGGVRLEMGASRNIVRGNYIGTDVTGEQAMPNQGAGVTIDNSSENVIGGPAVGNGNLISGNRDVGVLITGKEARGNRLERNLIGVMKSGTTALPNGDGGVSIVDAPDNIIGGPGTASASVGNLISGNNGDGVSIQGATATGNRVQDNYIGTDQDGVSAVGNSGFGVSILNAPNNLIGGDVPEATNVISGNQQGGVRIAGGEGATAAGNRLQNNFIGTDTSGEKALPNFGDAGVQLVNVSDTLIGGSHSLGNFIAGNAGVGLEITGGDRNRVQGNGIVGNSKDGVHVVGATGTIIGGTSEEQANLISGNGQNGILIENGATGTLVQGNLIGTDEAGTEAQGNGKTGVRVDSADGNLIGGLQIEAGNVISGNGEYGVLINEAQNNVVQGNLIGLDQAGKRILGNRATNVLITGGAGNLIGGVDVTAGNVIEGSGVVGVYLDHTRANSVLGNVISDNRAAGVYLVEASDNLIGAVEAGAGNDISRNGAAGVTVFSGTGNAIRGNSISENTGLGIDLGPTGVTPNDARDADDGGNRLQNFPVLTAAFTQNGGITVQGFLTSTPGRVFLLDFFSDANGQGDKHLGTLPVTTDVSGNVTFTATLPGTVTASDLITATATDTTTNDTSQFSQGIGLSRPAPAGSGNGASTNPGAAAIVPVLPVSNVTVALTNGRLDVSSAAMGNHLRIRLGVAGRDSVEITSLDGTLLNGQDVPLVFKKVKRGLRIRLGKGHSMLSLSGSQFTGLVQVEGGVQTDSYVLATHGVWVRVIDAGGGNRVAMRGVRAMRSQTEGVRWALFV